MYQRERENEILKILKKEGYVTVKYLVERLHYSNASINRDLNSLESQKLIRRTYGGVELIAQRGHGALPFRYHRGHAVKRKMAQVAAELIQDGDYIFIDATTTTQYIVEFLAEKKGVTVISNNMAVVMQASELGLKAICLGGTITEAPCMMWSVDTVETAKKYKADKAFLSTGYISPNGEIGDSELGGFLHRVMVENSTEAYLLADEEKFDEKYKTRVYCMDISKLTGVITDREIAESWREKFKNTQFIKV